MSQPTSLFPHPVTERPTEAGLRKAFHVAVSDVGGLTIHVGNETYEVGSTFSHPNMKPEHFNRFGPTLDETVAGPWSVAVRRAPNEIEMNGTGQHYRVHRMIEIQAHKLVIRDTFTNLTRDLLAVAFDNRVRPDREQRRMDISGPHNETNHRYDASEPAWNPTIYLEGESSGLGMVAVDDYYRLQVALRREALTACFHNESFGLPGGEAYTFQWEIYPTLFSDYYDFINLVRRDHTRPRTIEGPFCFAEYDFDLTQMRALISYTGAKVVVLFGPNSGAPWLGEDSNYYYRVEGFNLEEYIANLKQARALLKSIDPEIKVLAPFETALSPDQGSSDPLPVFKDSVSILPTDPQHVPLLPQGDPALYDPPDLHPWSHQYIYYPTLRNSYHRWVKERILMALREAELDGIYFDIFSYSGGRAPGFRWTYEKNRWDGHTVDINPGDYTVAATKGDLCKLSEDALADIVGAILSYKPGNVVVANGAGVPGKIRALPIFHFVESITHDGYQTTHFSTPIVLGYSAGYGAQLKWNAASDQFRDIRDKLRSGCLQYTYTPTDDWLTEPVEGRPFASRLFPITVEEIHAGWIKGRERIVTLLPGTYSWNDDSHAVGHCYDADGKEVASTVKPIARADGTQAFEIQFPPEGAGVLVRHPRRGTAAGAPT